MYAYPQDEMYRKPQNPGIFALFFREISVGAGVRLTGKKLGLLREGLCGATFWVSQAIKAQLDIQE